MEQQTQQKIPELYVPQLKQEHRIACYAQLRPFRQGGPRIQKEKLHGKTFIHNYGHGGAGVSLAPATSHQAIELASPLISAEQQIAIIGSGVIGLLNAFLLKERYPGTKISIYAQQIPRFGNKDNSQLITSQIAPGYWLPYSYGLQDQKKHNRWSSFAFLWYSKLAQRQRYRAVVKEVEVYSVSDNGVYEEEGKLTENLKPTGKLVEVNLNGKLKVQAYVIKTLKIDMQPFLNLLIQDLKNLSVTFVCKKVTRENMPKLTQNIIFNCTGLGSRQLFGDTKMKGLKGHMIEYKNTLPQKYNYFLKVSLGDKYMAYYMHDSRILIGRIVQHDETRTVNQKVVKEIEGVHRAIFQKFGQMQPKL